MVLIKFSDWVLAKESSPATRLRAAAARGLMPPIPDAAINSRSTASPFEQKALKGKGNKRRKGRKKKVTTKNTEIDAFIRSVEQLEKDMEALGKVRDKTEKSKKTAKNDKDKPIKGKKDQDDKDKPIKDKKDQDDDGNESGKREKDRDDKESKKS